MMPTNAGHNLVISQRLKEVLYGRLMMSDGNADKCIEDIIQ